MSKLFKKMLNDVTPKFNPYVVNGMVEHELRRMVEFIDIVFRSSTKSFNKEINISYEGYRYVSPEEEFHRAYTRNSSKKPYDLAQSDVYPICFIFKYENQIIEKVLLLPYAKKGNLMNISGSEKIIVPVLSDTIISPSEHQVFVRLYKDKITFKAEPHNYLYNGDVRTANNIWVVILKDKVKSEGLGDGSIPPAALYLLGKYGFRETVKKYFNKEFLQNDLNYELQDDDIIMVHGDTSKYKDQYNIYSGRGVARSDINLVENYEPHDISICLKKTIEETPFIKNFIFGLIYALDILPDEASQVYDGYLHQDVDYEIKLWRNILGIITYKKTKTIVKVVDDTRELFIALDNYMCGTIIAKLATVGIFVDDVYDLVYEILRRYDYWSLKAKEYNMDVNNRHIDVLYYMAYPFIERINRTIYSINKRYKKAKQQNKDITLKEIMNLFNKDLTHTLIFTIVQTTDPHFNIKGGKGYNSSVYLSCSSLLEDQGCAKGVIVARDGRMPSHCKFLNAHAMFFGSVLFLSKSKPSINFRINPFVKVDELTGKIKFTKKEEVMIKYINDHIVNIDEDGDDRYDGVRTDAQILELAKEIE